MIRSQFLLFAAIIVLALLTGACTVQPVSAQPQSVVEQAVPGDASDRPDACAVTPMILDKPPDDPNADPFALAYWYINDDFTIWAGPFAKDGYWQTGGQKALWIRPQGSDLTIQGRRLDGDAPPLEASIPCCYPTSFQSTSLYFPTAGCWEVHATAGEKELRFVTLVRQGNDSPHK
jgi:hypothetical protein